MIIPVSSSDGLQELINLFKELGQNGLMTGGKQLPENVEEGKFLKSVSIGKEKLALSEVENRITTGLYNLYQSYPQDSFCTEDLIICPSVLDSIRTNFHFAIQKWQHLSVKLSHRCRLKC